MGWIASMVAAAGISVTTDATYVTLDNGLISIQVRKSDGRVVQLIPQGKSNILEPNVGMYSDMQLLGTPIPTNNFNHVYPGPTATYRLVTNTAQMVDVEFRDAKWGADVMTLFGYDPQFTNGLFDIAMHYVMRAGDSGFYSYVVWRHTAAQPQIEFDIPRHPIRGSSLLFQSNTNGYRAYSYAAPYMNGMSIGDDMMAQGVSIANAVLKLPQNTQYDGPHGYTSDGFPVYTKFDWNPDPGATMYDNPLIGTYNDQTGLWLINASHEWQNGGPAREGSGGAQENHLSWMLEDGHNFGADINKLCTNNEVWVKVFGPYFVYCNQGTNHQQLLTNALARVAVEQNAWPYSWVTESETLYPRTRGTVTGQILVDGQPGAGATVILCDPAADWRAQGAKDFNFWMRADTNGNFTVPKVRPGIYSLYYYTPGCLGEGRVDGVVVTGGQTNSLGEIHYDDPRRQQRLWRVGTPDRTTGEFRFGNLPRQFGLWWRYLEEVGTNDLTFVVEQSSSSNGWYYAQPLVCLDDGRIFGPTWNVQFTLTNLPPAPAVLTVALAGAIYGTPVYVKVNGQSVATFNTINDSCLYRDFTISGWYQPYEVSFDPNLLLIGTNNISFYIARDPRWDVFYATKPELPWGGIMWDCVQLEGGAAQDLVWKGGGSGNSWTEGSGDNWFNGFSRAPFNNGNSVLFDNSGSAQPAVAIAGPLQPGAVVVDAGQGYTFSGNGALIGPMSLVKSGSGRLTLENANAYLGSTLINEGELLVNGSLSNSPVRVLGGSLGGTGLITGPVTVSAGGVLAPGGANLPGPLTLAQDLTLTNASLLFRLAATNTGSSGRIQLGGGALNLAGLNLVQPYYLADRLAAGVYPLIQGAGAINGGLANLALDIPAGGMRQTMSLDTNTPGTLQLNVSGPAAASLIWQGTNGSAWDVNSTINWRNGAVADRFYNLDVVTFDDTSTNGIVNLAGNPEPWRVVVTNSSRSYTIAGGGWNGAGSLVKNGSGSLTLNGTNNFRGGTTLNAGKIILGAGELSNAGIGTGPINFNGGTLQLNGYGGSGSTTWGAFTNDLVIPAGQTGTLLCPPRMASPMVAGRLVGGGTLNLTVDYVRGGLTGEWSEFDGRIIVSSRTGTSECRLSGTNGYARAAFQLNANVILDHVTGNDQIIEIGELSGVGVVGPGNLASLNPTWRVGGRNTSATYSGLITNAGVTSVIKTGAGVWTLTGANGYSGGTTVNQGTLLVNNLSGSGTGSGWVKVVNGGALGGGGSIAGPVTIHAGSLLMPGSNGIGTLTLNDSLVLAPGSRTQVELQKTALTNDQVRVTGTATLGGTLVVTNLGGGTLAAGDRFTLFTAGGFAGSFSALEPAVPGPGLIWDAGRLAADGVLRIMNATPPRFTGLDRVGSNLVLRGTNGTPGYACRLLTSTNLALPLALWTPVATNTFAPDGSLQFIVPMGSGISFHALQVP